MLGGAVEPVGGGGAIPRGGCTAGSVLKLHAAHRLTKVTTRMTRYVGLPFPPTTPCRLAFCRSNADSGPTTRSCGIPCSIQHLSLRRYDGPARSLPRWADVQSP